MGHLSQGDAMKYRVFYTDTNLFSKEELPLYLECGNSYYLGNIVDSIYSPPSKQKQIKNKIQEIIEFAGDRYVSGDRELIPDRLYHIIDDDILITYGDNIFNKKRYSQYSIWRYIFAFFYKVFLRYKTKEFILDNELRLISDKAIHYNCTTIVMSYFNPTTIIDTEYNGIRIIILPKGRTSFYI